MHFAKAQRLAKVCDRAKGRGSRADIPVKTISKAGSSLYRQSGDAVRSGQPS